MQELMQLSQEWLEAKAAEEAAKLKRYEIEAKVTARLTAPEEGSKTYRLDKFKAVLSGRLNYRADVPQLITLAEQLPPHLRPLKTETVLDTKGAKWIRENEPDMWQIIAPAIEVKPAKTGVKIEIIDN